MAAVVLPSLCGGSHEIGDQTPRSNVYENDRFLPFNKISRIMRKPVHRNGKVTKHAKEAMQECVTEFISFITSKVNDSCQKEKIKKINGVDILRAMATLGFEDYIDPLRLYLQRYMEIEGDDKGSAKGAKGAKGAKSSGTRDAGGLQGGNLPGSSMQGDMMGDTGGLQGGILPGSSMQGDMMGDAGGLQG